MSWYDVDRKGFRDLVSGRERWRLLIENVSNAFDAAPTNVVVTTKREPKSPFVEFTFEDDGEGFSDIRLAYTFYADTDRRSDPTKRGRFTIGEKVALSAAEKAVIESRDKRVTFDETGRNQTTLRTTRIGTLASLLIRMNVDDEQSVLKKLKQVHVPDGIAYKVNDDVISSSTPLKTFVATFESPIKTEDGALRLRSRETEVRLYECLLTNHEKVGYLYELGVPVQQIAIPYDVNILQKIPLSQDREVVSDRFLQDIYAEVLNVVANELPEDHASDTWVRTAIADQRCKPDAVEKVKEKRYGGRAVLWSSDIEANERAIGAGYQIIHPRTLSEDERKRFEQVGLEHASKVFGSTLKEAPEYKPTPAMLKIAEFAKILAKELIGRDIYVGFHSLFGAGYGAEYGYGELQFNVANLGKAWFEHGITTQVVGLIVHELGHDRADDPDFAHGHVYQQRESELVGKLALLARDKPDRYKEIFEKSAEEDSEREPTQD